MDYVSLRQSALIINWFIAEARWSDYSRTLQFPHSRVHFWTI